MKQCRKNLLHSAQWQILRGFSLLELVVVIAVIGILLALIVPAIQHARETSRRLQCTNNLKQLGTGILAFESVHGHFPALASEQKYGNWVVDILPHLDQQALYKEVEKLYGGFQLEPHRSIEELNQRMWGLQEMILPGFHCPSDPQRPNGVISYPGNSGLWTLQFGYLGLFRVDAPSFALGMRIGPVRVRDVTDGLSNTMMNSEWLPAPAKWNYQDRLDTYKRCAWLLPMKIGTSAEVESVIPACREVPRVWPPDYGWRVSRALGTDQWTDGPEGISAYNHAMTPNQPSCRPIDGPGTISGFYTAGSFHTQGVNGLYGDGHVSFVSDDIDQSVWHELGTRQPGRDFAF